MNATTAMFGIFFALLVGAMSPGPSFLMVAQRAISLSRTEGLACAAGMGAGAVLFSGIALFGLYTLITALGWVFSLIKAAGGAYLVFLGYKIWRGAKAPLRSDVAALSGSVRIRQSFWQGFATQTSNPKTALVYGSVFAAFLPHEIDRWCYFALPPLVFFLEAGWYSLVAICLASQRPRNAYKNVKTRIDRIAAGVMTLLGIRLIVTACQP